MPEKRIFTKNQSIGKPKKAEPCDISDLKLSQLKYKKKNAKKIEMLSTEVIYIFLQPLCRVERTFL